jgi:hypothetical protein
LEHHPLTNASDLLRNTYLIIVQGFQTPMDPSPNPPATKPSENSSDEDGLDHDSRLNRSGLGTDATHGRSGASDWKSSLNSSRFAEELKDRSTAPAIVPAARYGASGAIATSADRCALLIHAMRGEREEKGLWIFLEMDVSDLGGSENSQNHTGVVKNQNSTEVLLSFI